MILKVEREEDERKSALRNLTPAELQGTSPKSWLIVDLSNNLRQIAYGKMIRAILVLTIKIGLFIVDRRELLNERLLRRRDDDWSAKGIAI